MRRCLLLFCLLVLRLLIAAAADWRSSGGDAQLTRWQRDETELTRMTVGRMRLLWRQELPGSASAPLLLGPIVTHRGIKELVIVSDGGSVQAIDADLGKVFWVKPIGGDTGGGCSPRTPAPAIAKGRALSPEEEAAPPTQSIFALAGDGYLHTLRPSDGEDVRAALPFLRAGVQASDLVASDDSIYAAWRACGSDERGVTAIAMRGVTPQARLIIPADRALGRTPVVSIGRDGKIHTGLPGDIARLEYPNGTWSSFEPMEGGKLAAFRGADHRRVWEVDAGNAVSAPVAANGIVFVTGGGALKAIDAESGKILFSAAEKADGAVAGLAVANGHVCFTAGRSVLCYGLPIEI